MNRIALGLLLTALALTGKVEAKTYALDQEIDCNPSSPQDFRGPAKIFAQRASEHWRQLQEALASQTTQVLLAEAEAPRGKRSRSEPPAPGRFRLVFASPIPPTGALAVAKEVDTRRTRVALLEQAFLRDPLSSMGTSRSIDVTLAELHRLRKDPEALRNTVVGATLRQGWARVLEGPDDLERTQARLTPLLTLAYTDGTQGAVFAADALPEETTNLLLGRSKTPRQRVLEATGKLAPSQELSPQTAQAVTDALRWVRDRGAAEDAALTQILGLRRAAPDELSAADMALLAKFNRPVRVREGALQRVPKLRD